MRTSRWNAIGGRNLLGAARLERTAEGVTLSLAHIRRLYFAAYDPKGGGVEHGPRIFEQPTCHHRPEVYGGIAERAAAALLRKFFQARR